KTEGMKFARITLSDRAAAGVYSDRSGPAIQQFFAERVATPVEWEQVLIPDERAEIERILRELCDSEEVALIVTTGGTGPSPRDITPEA
ncbi:molybdopterin-binding protein, partial [Listeria monocytogenes]|uniref:molybdopterin-binding protein n=1 Tax=Listeria monocytogenes TaxID=1639 RepID=UPI002FDC6F91